MPLSNFVRRRVQGRIAEGETDAQWPPATSYQVKLFTDSLDADGNGVELQGSGYDPLVVPITGVFVVGPAPLFEISNAVPLDFGFATSLELGPIISYGVFDQADALQWFADLDAPRTVPIGAQYAFGIGQLRSRFT